MPEHKGQEGLTEQMKWVKYRPRYCSIINEWPSKSFSNVDTSKGFLNVATSKRFFIRGRISISAANFYYTAPKY